MCDVRDIENVRLSSKVTIKNYREFEENRDKEKIVEFIKEIY